MSRNRTNPYRVFDSETHTTGKPIEISQIFLSGFALQTEAGFYGIVLHLDAVIIVVRRVLLGRGVALPVGLSGDPRSIFILFRLLVDDRFQFSDHKPATYGKLFDVRLDVDRK